MASLRCIALAKTAVDNVDPGAEFARHGTQPVRSVCTEEFRKWLEAPYRLLHRILIRVRFDIFIDKSSLFVDDSLVHRARTNSRPMLEHQLQAELQFPHIDPGARTGNCAETARPGDGDSCGA
jgi:hypothetical protein